MVQVFTALVAFLVVSVSLCEGRRIRKSKFEESDLAEISGIVGYMVARFGRNQDTHTSRRIGDEWKNSAFVSTVFNVFTDKRVLTNEMVKEAIGHSCDALEIRDSDSCRNSPYATIDWEAAVYQWKFTPSKELVKKAMGDFCYFSSKFVFGQPEQRSLDGYEECKTSSYVDLLYNYANTGDFNVQRYGSKIASEAFGDVCYFGCLLAKYDRNTCKQKEMKCQKSNYVQLVYNILQKKNPFTEDVLEGLVRDGVYVYERYYRGQTERSARKMGYKYKNSEMTDIIKLVVKFLSKQFNWPIENNDCDYDDYCD